MAATYLISLSYFSRISLELFQSFFESSSDTYYAWKRMYC